MKKKLEKIIRGSQLVKNNNMITCG